MWLGRGEEGVVWMLPAIKPCTACVCAIETDTNLLNIQGAQGMLHPTSVVFCTCGLLVFIHGLSMHLVAIGPTRWVFFTECPPL
jgi:hypothetical protein